MSFSVKDTILACFLSFPAIPTVAVSQGPEFVQRTGTGLSLSKKPFYAVGVNAYYLQERVARGDTLHVLEALSAARNLGATVIRTWGFFDGADSTDLAVIQFSPGRYHEAALRALDYVVARAGEFSFRLAIPLVNNWDDYGGMNQYVRWVSGSTMPVSAAANDTARQKKIVGAAGRSYSVFVSTSLSHDDFYRHPAVKQWYKEYVSMLLNRTNVYTGVAYKDDPTIFLWELANEPRSSDRSGTIVSDWVNEMSSVIKSIDANHLVGTGEEGHDVTAAGYDLSPYGGQHWMFDGSTGTSFRMNVSSPGIDVASVHAYPEDWGIAPGSAIHWVKDHQRIAAAQGKPVVVGEIGIRRARIPFFDAVFGTAWAENISGVIPWQLVYSGWPYSDGLAFSCPGDSGICELFTRHAALFRQKETATYVPPSSVRFLQNYPNPFNYTSALSFELSEISHVKLEIFNVLGERVSTLADGEQGTGRHVLLLDAFGMSSGLYVARLTVGGITLHQKIVLVK